MINTPDCPIVNILRRDDGTTLWVFENGGILRRSDKGETTLYERDWLRDLSTALVRWKTERQSKDPVEFSEKANEYVVLPLRELFSGLFEINDIDDFIRRYPPSDSDDSRLSKLRFKEKPVLVSVGGTKGSPCTEFTEYFGDYSVLTLTMSGGFGYLPGWSVRVCRNHITEFFSSLSEELSDESIDDKNVENANDGSR